MKLRAAGREVRRRIAWPAVLDAIVVVVKLCGNSGSRCREVMTNCDSKDYGVL